MFIFFAAYLILAVTHIGWRRAALFTAFAYTVAFLCEWSSAVAATGFPFGLGQEARRNRSRRASSKSRLITCP